MKRRARSWLTLPLAADLPVLACLTLGSMVSVRLLPYAAIAAAAFWPLRRLLAGRFTQRTPADLPMALLALTLPVTWWATALPETTWPQVLRLLGGIGLYYSVVNWAVPDPQIHEEGEGSSPGSHARPGDVAPSPAGCPFPRRLYWIWSALLLAAIGLAAAAPFSVSWYITKIPLIPEWVYTRFPVLVEDAVHPNVMAGSLALLVPLPAAGLLFAGRRLRPSVWLLAGLSFLASIVMIALTQSRGAWVAAGASLLLLGVLRWGAARIALGCSVGGAAAAAYCLGWLPGLTGVLSSGTAAGLAEKMSSSAMTTWDGRLEIWSRAISMIQDFAFTGVGMGSYGPVADALYPFFLAEPGSIPHAHNLFLQVGVDLGIPGLIAWLAVLLLSLQAAWQVYRFGRKAGDGFTAGLGAGLLASALALVLHGLFDAVTWGMVKPAPLVWALWGLANAAAIAIRDRQR